MDVRLRYWDINQHLRHLNENDWQPLVGPDGVPLSGISGKRGVRGVKPDGSYLGADFIRMQPGARFALHTHEGDHEIYFIRGTGFVHIDGQDIAVRGGHLIHIAAEKPHGIWVPDATGIPLVFAAAGHPHHHVYERDRMRLVEDE